MKDEAREPAGIIRLGPFWESSAARNQAIIRLRARMMWPDDAATRQSVEIVWAAAALARAEAAFPKLPPDVDPRERDDDALFIESFRRWFEEMGGLAVLAEQPRLSDIRKIREIRMKPAGTVGRLLAEVCRLEQCHPDLQMGASLSKAIKIILARNYPDLFLTSESKIREAWHNYRPVAHLWAAEVMLGRDGAPPFDRSAQALGDLLQLAIHVRRVALTVRPHGMKGKPLLRPDELVEIDPYGLDPLPPYGFLPLDEETLARSGLIAGDG